MRDQTNKIKSRRSVKNKAMDSAYYNDCQNLIKFQNPVRMAEESIRHYKSRCRLEHRLWRDTLSATSERFERLGYTPEHMPKSTSLKTSIDNNYKYKNIEIRVCRASGGKVKPPKISSPYRKKRATSPYSEFWTIHTNPNIKSVLDAWRGIYQLNPMND